MIYRLDITTKTMVEFQEITSKVKDAVARSGVQKGVCLVFVPHTTAAVTVNEHADPSVAADITAQLEAMVPRSHNYRHAEGNATAHIKASLMGSSATLFIEKGQVVLGTWQGIFFCEFDGPRERTVMIKVVGEN